MSGLKVCLISILYTDYIQVVLCSAFTIYNRKCAHTQSNTHVECTFRGVAHRLKDWNKLWVVVKHKD